MKGANCVQGNLASLERFERSTRCLEGSRSIQLSYRDELASLKIYHECKTRSIYLFYLCFIFFRRMLLKMFDVPINIENNQSDDYRDEYWVEGTHGIP